MNSKTVKEVKYRVYDAKGSYQQSYSGQLAGGYSWAKDCARRVGGYITESFIENGAEVSNGIVLDLRARA
jgi:hypothetical protein